MKKNILKILFIFFISLGLSTPSFALSYFNDNANILTKEQDAELNKNLQDIEKNNPKHPQIVFFIEKEIKNDIAQWSDEKFHDLQLGQKDLNNGILVAFDMKNHKNHISTGLGLEGDLPDISCAKILASSQGDFQNEKFYDGLKKIITTLQTAIESPEDFLKKAKLEEKQKEYNFIIIMIVLLVAIIAVIIIIKKNGGSVTEFAAGVIISGISNGGGDGSFDGGGGDCGGGGASGGW